jgi:hypothetical protein
MPGGAETGSCAHGRRATRSRTVERLEGSLQIAPGSGLRIQGALEPKGQTTR